MYGKRNPSNFRLVVPFAQAAFKIPNFYVLIHFPLKKVVRKELFSCKQKVHHVPNYIAKIGKQSEPSKELRSGNMLCDSRFPDPSRTPARFAFNFPLRFPLSSLFPALKSLVSGY